MSLCNVGTTINNEKVDVAYCSKSTVKKKFILSQDFFSVFLGCFVICYSVIRKITE